MDWTLESLEDGYGWRIVDSRDEVDPPIDRFTIYEGRFPLVIQDNGELPGYDGDTRILELDTRLLDVNDGCRGIGVGGGNDNGGDSGVGDSVGGAGGNGCGGAGPQAATVELAVVTWKAMEAAVEAAVEVVEEK